jgi:bifunctional DNA-binding transcriptional regulator/antitoxin component of YhaV-PrlF toxin-antitoxin module
MTTTINVSTKRQVVLPKKFCDRKKIKPGTALRVTEVGEGLYVTPISAPNAKELSNVIRRAGSLRRRQTAKEEQMVQHLIRDYRNEKRRHKR